MTNDVGQDTIQNKEDCGELIAECDWIGKVIRQVVNRRTTGTLLKKTFKELDEYALTISFNRRSWLKLTSGWSTIFLGIWNA